MSDPLVTTQTSKPPLVDDPLKSWTPFPVSNPGWSPPDSVSKEVGHQANITPLDVPQNAVPNSENYAAAFDAGNPIYSVNTGNASVVQLEDLRSVVSPAPAIVVHDDYSFVLPTGILAFLFLL